MAVSSLKSQVTIHLEVNIFWTYQKKKKKENKPKTKSNKYILLVTFYVIQGSRSAHLDARGDTHWDSPSSWWTWRSRIALGKKKERDHSQSSKVTNTGVFKQSEPQHQRPKVIARLTRSPGLPSFPSIPSIPGGPYDDKQSVKTSRKHARRAKKGDICTISPGEPGDPGGPVGPWEP